MYIVKKANVDLQSVIINTENVEYNKANERYEYVVPNGNKPNVVITAVNLNQTVQLLDEYGKVLATGTGSITTTLTLDAITLNNDYIIKVISHNGETLGFKEYKLNIRQKSIEDRNNVYQSRWLRNVVK